MFIINPMGMLDSRKIGGKKIVAQILFRYTYCYIFGITENGTKRGRTDLQTRNITILETKKRRLKCSDNIQRLINIFSLFRHYITFSLFSNSFLLPIGMYTSSGFCSPFKQIFFTKKFIDPPKYLFAHLLLSCIKNTKNTSENFRLKFAH